MNIKVLIGENVLMSVKTLKYIKKSDWMLSILIVVVIWHYALSKLVQLYTEKGKIFCL